MAQQFPNIYYYNENLKLLVCKEDQVAIPQKKGLAHLKEKHFFTDYQIEENGWRIGLAGVVQDSLDSVSRRLKEDQPVSAIPFLPQLNGVECKECGDAFSSGDNAWRHVRERHGVQDVKKNAGRYTTECPLQTVCSGKVFKILRPNRLVSCNLAN